MEQRKKVGLTTVLVVLLISLFAFFLYTKKDTVPGEVKELYINYLETIKSDYAKAVNEYCHFEMPAIKEMTEQADDYITSYNILGWEKLNDDLWAVETSFKTLSIPGGSTMYNFIGKLNGKYYVMINAYQVPPQLHKNFNPLHYIPPNAVPYENVIGMVN